MPFVLPTFNVPVNVFSHGLPPPAGPARILGLLANVSLGRRVMLGADSLIYFGGTAHGLGINLFVRIMMVAALTDLRGAYFQAAPAWDFVEMPAGSGAIYDVLDVADMAKGFPNEHRVAWLVPDVNFPMPIPLP